MKKKILLRGPVLSRSGYGEQTRFALRALRTRPDLFDIYLVNTPWGSTGQITDYDLRKSLDTDLIRTAHYNQKGGAFDISIQVTIPIEFEKIAPVNIGYTAGIETNRISASWIEKSNEMVDKIITISKHSRDGLVNTQYDVTNQKTGEQISGWSLNVPVEIVNYAVLEHTPTPLNINLETETNFLAVSQWGPRKNLDNTIKWFIEEFRDDDNAGLVLKANSASDSTPDREFTNLRLQQLIEQCGEKKCKIYLIHGELTAGELTWLYQHPTMKALVNIGHGEGYGLPLFEAAYNGLPLVTICWSGQMDFICKPNKNGKNFPRVARVDYDIKPVQKHAVWENVIEKDSMWAFAKEASYKRALRDVATKSAHFKKEATALQKHIKKNFTEEKIYADFCRHIWNPSEAELERLDKLVLQDSADMLAGVNLL